MIMVIKSGKVRCAEYVTLIGDVKSFGWKRK
jgi:hypothetical protein